MEKVKVVTHNGRFHADDVSAVAVLDLVHKGNIEVVRTRDQAVIDGGDVVLDLGGTYDEKRIFDHHQPGGAGTRPNGVPYAAFGLIWKHFGKQLCSEAVWRKFDIVFVQPVDAADNGFQIVQSIVDNLRPFSFDSLVYSCNPTWKEDPETRDTKFLETVEVLKKIIARELMFLAHEDEAKELVLKNYNEAEDKRIIILDKNYPYHDVLCEREEPVYAIYKSPQLESWHVGGVPVKGKVQQVRKTLPAPWGGKMNEELQKISGVPDALFCHNKIFMGTAKTKEGAIAMAKLALDDK